MIPILLKKREVLKIEIIQIRALDPAFFAPYFCFCTLVECGFYGCNKDGPLLEPDSSLTVLMEFKGWPHTVPDISEKISRTVLRQWPLLLNLGRRISGSHQASGGCLADVSQVGFKGLHWY